MKLWAAGKIEDTPHGCFARMMREGRSAESGTSKSHEYQEVGPLA